MPRLIWLAVVMLVLVLVVAMMLLGPLVIPGLILVSDEMFPACCLVRSVDLCVTDFVLTEL